MSKSKPLNLQISYGNFGTRIGLHVFTATEYFLVKDHNEDIMIRIQDTRLRFLAINVTPKEYDIMFKEIGSKTKLVRDKASLTSFYLWAEGVQIAIFRYTKEIDEIADEAKEKFGDTLKKLAD